MNSQQILDRTIFQILNPSFNPLLINQNVQKVNLEAMEKIDIILQKIQDWLQYQFDKFYYRVQDYDLLELQLQKAQKDIRFHIRNEEQLRIWCQKLSQKNQKVQKDYQFLDKKVESIINGLKETNKKLKNQNIYLISLLNKQINNLSDDNKKQRDENLTDTNCISPSNLWKPNHKKTQSIGSQNLHKYQYISYKQIKNCK